MKPEKLIVVGCSCGGKEACEYLFPLLKLNSSSVVLAPHIQNDKIYDSLRSSLGSNVRGIEDSSSLESGNVYVFDRDKIQAPFRNSIILKGNRFNFIESHNQNSIDNIMINLTDSYHGNIIGVVLSGSGNDGSKGVQHIKENNGSVLVQVENSQIRNANSIDRRNNHYYYDAMYYCPKMPFNAQNAVNVDFSGPLSDLVPVLNAMA